MASIVEVTRAAQALEGLGVGVGFLEEHDPEIEARTGRLVPVTISAMVHKPGQPGKPHKGMIGKAVPLENRPRGLVEAMALDCLMARFEEIKAAAELEKARALVAANPPPPPPEPEEKPEETKPSETE